MRGPKPAGAERLNEEAIAAELVTLPGWTLQKGKLHREFKCRDFAQAFACMTKVAQAAEEMNHHPDWSNSWNRVSIDLVTHSAGGLTRLDFELARRIDGIFGA